jgi:hypothetical protein
MNTAEGTLREALEAGTTRYTHGRGEDSFDSDLDYDDPEPRKPGLAYEVVFTIPQWEKVQQALAAAVTGTSATARRDFTRPEGLYLKFSEPLAEPNTPVIIERVNGDCTVSQFIMARDEAHKLVDQLRSFLEEHKCHR